MDPNFPSRKDTIHTTYPSEIPLGEDSEASEFRVHSLAPAVWLLWKFGKQASPDGLIATPGPGGRRRREQWFHCRRPCPSAPIHHRRREDRETLTAVQVSHRIIRDVLVLFGMRILHFLLYLSKQISLLEKSWKFEWTTEVNVTFERLKISLANPPPIFVVEPASRGWPCI
jgi:hypothetical protein